MANADGRCRTRSGEYARGDQTQVRARRPEIPRLLALFRRLDPLARSQLAPELDGLDPATLAALESMVTALEDAASPATAAQAMHLLMAAWRAVHGR
jgi:hypothetical protein